MKKYILIQNDGEIETNSFELIGASTKRNEAGKIGFFGSGLKYSIAYMMRNNIDFRVFSGEQELKFTTIPETLKEQTFDRICINGKPTSYTVTMGPTWKEDWYVLREVYCNALDEGICQLVKETTLVSPSTGKTRIYIQLTDSLQKVISSWDAYFTDERNPLFTADGVYTLSLGSEDSGGKYKQSIAVYEKTEGVLYRKGIRVFQKKYWLHDYGAEYVNINEDRTARSAYALGYGIAYMAAHISNESWLKSILRQRDVSGSEYTDLSSDGTDNGASDKWIEFSKNNLIIVEEISGRFASEINESKREVFLIPHLFAKRIKKYVPEATICGMGNAVEDVYYNEIEASQKMNYLLKEVVQSLKEMKYEVTWPIKIVDFDNDKTLGAAIKDSKTILLASKVFDMGRREIAMTIMEEVEHLSSGHDDETRAFQNHLFSQWLKTMENSNGLFL